MNKFIDKKTFKFIIVGIANTFFGMGIMLFLYNIIGFNYWISSISNYVIGSILSYFLNKYFTFKDSQNIKKSVFKFIINIVICYFLAYGVSRPIFNIILSNFSVKTKDTIIMIFGAIFFVFINYIGQRYFVFKDKN